MDQVKQMVRSILLSAKLGVALNDIQKDYEMLACSRLPYRQFGFNDVGSFMRSMPDVAHETRNSSGDVVYVAVCDDSTAHIQKMVSNQRTSSSKKKSRPLRGRGGGFRGRGSFRGRGGLTRFGTDRGRGGGFVRVRKKGRSSQGMMYKSRPAPPPPRRFTAQSGRSTSYGSVQGSLGAGDFRSRMYQNNEDSFVGEDDYSINLSIAKAYNEIERLDHLDDEPIHRNRQRSVLSNLENSQTDTSRDTWEEDDCTRQRDKENNVSDLRLTIRASGSRRTVSSIDDSEPVHVSTNGPKQEDLRQFLNRKREHHNSGDSQTSATSLGQHSSPNSKRNYTVNLDYVKGVLSDTETANKKMAVGKRVTFKNTRQSAQPPRRKNLQPQPYDRMQRLDDESRNQIDSEKEDVVSPRRVYRTENSSSDGTKNQNWEKPHKDGALYLETFYDHFRKLGKTPPQVEVVPGKVQGRKGYYGRIQGPSGEIIYNLQIFKSAIEAEQSAAMQYCKENKIPLKGSEACGDRPVLKAKDNDGGPPTANFKPPWLKESSLQSLVQPGGMSPTDKSANKDLGSQSSASAEADKSSSSIAFPGKDTQPAWLSKQFRSLIESEPSSSSAQSEGKGSATSASQQASSPLDRLTKDGIGERPVSSASAESVGRDISRLSLDSAPARAKVSATPQSSGCPPDVMEKLYNMLPSCGVWAKAIPQMYENKYEGETLSVDVIAATTEWSDFFTAEQLITGRVVIYPKRCAAEKLPSIVNSAGDSALQAKEADSSMGLEFVPVPEYTKPELGSELEVFFTFAYSEQEVFLQPVAEEDTVYRIDQVLIDECPTLPEVNLEDVTVDSLMAAHYCEGWYRARVLKVNADGVEVYFIDYGNTEEVPASSLRDIPSDQIVRKIPPLAMSCCLRKPKDMTGPWFSNAGDVLTTIGNSGQNLVARVLSYSGHKCVIDLILPAEGELINSLLIKEGPDSPTQEKETELLQQQQQPPQPATVVSVDQKKQDLELQRTDSVSSGSVCSSNFSSSVQNRGKVFSEDPEPLQIPDYKSFAVYVCTVLTESTVLVRIIDSQYSEKLDELEQQIGEMFDTWPRPSEIKNTNVYACLIEREDEECEEDEEEEETIKYYRARVLEEKPQEGTVSVYLPDHGHNEVVSRDNLREIDHGLNTSLSYQAVLANLHGLKDIPEKHRVLAAEALIKLTLDQPMTFVAVKQNMDDDPTGSVVDKVTINRVRKIMSCVKEVSAETVAKIYQSVFQEPLEDVEEIIKHIPGFGFWKEALDIELFDTTNQEEDRNINQTVLEVIKRVEQCQAEGRDGSGVLKEMFGSSTNSLTDSSEQCDIPSQEGGRKSLAHSGSSNNLQQQFLSGTQLLSDANRPPQSSSPDHIPLSGGDESQIKMDRTKDYVQQYGRITSPNPPGSPPTVQTPQAPEANLKNKSLYTWVNPKLLKDQPEPQTPKVETLSGGQSSHPLTSTPLYDVPHPGLRAITSGPSLPTSAALPVLSDSQCPAVPALPKPWMYAEGGFFAENEVYIVSAESPANFVAIPYSMKEALLSLQTAMTTYFMSPRPHVTSLSRKCLYAVKKDCYWQRALFKRLLTPGGIQVYYPDHGSFDVVNPPQLFELPPDFYTMHFLARLMRLGAYPSDYPDWKTVAPKTQDWSEASKFFFISNVLKKYLFVYVHKELELETSLSDLTTPKSITVQLVDTTGSSDVIVDVLMCDKGFAKRPIIPDQDV